MKKYLTLLLALLILTVTILGACGNGNDVANTTAGNLPGTDTVTGTNTAETEDPATKPNIPDIRYDGYTYRVANSFVNDTKYTTNSIFNHEQIGEILEDAIYFRTVNMEERFGIKFEDCDVSPQAFLNSFNSGDDEFDLCTATLTNVMTIVNRKAVFDMNTLDSLDLEKPWWDQNAIAKLSFDGHLYYTFSDFVITGMDNGRAIYFNKTLHNELGLGDIYGMVKDGKWTYTVMTEMSEVAKNDLDGDGKISIDDRVGIVSGATTFYEALLTSCDAELVKQGNDGVPYFFCFDEQEKFVSIYQALLSTFSANDRLLISGGGVNMFKDGRVLFIVSTLSQAVKLRREDIDFGILPCPKWDESQKSYLNVSPNGHALMIPATVKNTERAGVILEALSYYSSRFASEDAVMPSYFDVALSTRSSRDEESAESLQIIHDSISYVIKITGTGFSDGVYKNFESGNMNITSLLKASSKVQKKLLADTIAKLREN